MRDFLSVLLTLLFEKISDLIINLSNKASRNIKARQERKKAKKAIDEFKEDRSEDTFNNLP